MVSVAELKEIFNTVFGNELEISNLTEDTDLRKDIGMNSVHLLYMAMVLEEKYGIQFENEDFQNINTISDVLLKIEGKV